MRFIIIATGYNCAEYVAKCIESVKAQSYTNWIMYVVSDGSTDNTGKEALKHIGENILVAECPDNLGAAYRRYEAIQHSKGNPEDVICLLGLDDELTPNALERVKQEYDNGKWMTYGNWVNQHGKGLPLNFQLDFEESTHKARSYRTVKYRSTAPNTFKKKLYDKIPIERHKVIGHWPKSDTESEAMFSCLEMCGKERIGIIKEPIYIYNQRQKMSARERLGSNYQDGIYAEVIKRTKMPLYEEF